MRLRAAGWPDWRGRQTRFLIAILLCWSGARAYLLWPEARKLADAVAPLVSAPWIASPELPAVASPFAPPAMTTFRSAKSRDRPIEISENTKATRWTWLQSGGEAMSATSVLRRASFAYRGPADKTPVQPTPPAPSPLFPQQRKASHRRIEAQAYLFWRPGGTVAALAGQGELGGSQFAARIAVPLGQGFAVAARAYAPLEHRGAEAAIGLDWHPVPSLPWRISVERRQRLDALGRSAWSAYGAGGFWRGGGTGTAQFDGYAQAGVVGTQRRDLFIDGALRIGYRLPTPKAAITLGAGLWGAAQPGVARLDAGPRMAIVLPVATHSLTLAIDGRLRMAGHAAPGSGAAVTLASDF